MHRIIGIKIDKHKLSKNVSIVDAGLPEFVYISISRHIGKPAKPCVNKDDKVKVGTLIASSTDNLSVNVYSSVSGVVSEISSKFIVIKVIGDEFEEYIDKTDDIITSIPDDKNFIIDRIKKFGIVGMGGAGFPTSVKLDIPEDKKINCFVINGVECEPYFTSDNRLMQEKAEELVIGARIVNKLLGIQNSIIAISEKNKEAIKAVTKVTKRYVGVNVKVVKDKYPSGAEKQLIKSLFGVEIPHSKLTLDRGYIVNNVATVYAIYEAVMKNKPPFQRVVTISGDAVDKPKNLLVRVGTTASYLLDRASVDLKEIEMLLLNGLFMGKRIDDFNTPISLLDAGLLAFRSAKQFTEATPCIRCNKCSANCPVSLQPFTIANSVKDNDTLSLYKLRVFDCISCGICSYVCPAKIPLLDFIKIAKEKTR